MKTRLYLWGILLAFGFPAFAEAKQKVDVDFVIDLTRKTDATYAVYTEVTIYGREEITEKNAEFHRGNLHRVETPWDRVIANCETGEGWHLNLLDGSLKSDKSVALSACGIDANRPIFTKNMTEEHSAKFGKLWRVTITDRDNVRRYDVNKDGVIINAAVWQNTPDRELFLKQTGVQVTSDLPDSDIFSKESLERSYLPE